MKNGKRSTLFGAALIVLGILLGLLLGQWQEEKLQKLLVKLPFGGLSRPAASVGGTLPDAPLLEAGDERFIHLQYGSDCAYRPDEAALLFRSLDCNLLGDEPTVLILHTHASECYTRQNGENYSQGADFRTLNTDYNMVAVGDKLTALLEEAGISVLHDRVLHDYPTYSQSYSNARRSTQALLEQYPSIRLVLDLHRDSMLNSDGSQYAATAIVDGELAARMMLVVGTDAAGMNHPNWQENLSLGLKLQVLLEKNAPGITRPTMLRAQRFNQDLLPGALIVEMGAAGNSLSEAMKSAEYLAEAIVNLTKANSTS